MKRAIYAAICVGGVMFSAACERDGLRDYDSGAPREKISFDAVISDAERSSRVSGSWNGEGIDVLWSGTDRIGVFSDDDAEAAVFGIKELDGASAVFEGEIAPAEKSYLAYYPYGGSLAHDGAGLSGRMRFLQGYDFGGYGPDKVGILPEFFPMMAVSPAGSGHLDFRQMLAYMRIRVEASEHFDDDVYLKGIIFQGNNGEILAGDAVKVVPAAAENVALNIAEGDPVLSFEAADNTYSAVALDLVDHSEAEDEKNGVPLSRDDFVEFYLALPPLRFEKGCKITFVDTKNRYMSTLSTTAFDAGRARFVTFLSGGAEKTFEYDVDNSMVWQDTRHLVVEAHHQTEKPSGYDLTNGDENNIANCYIITPEMLDSAPDGIFWFPAKSPQKSGTVWDGLLLDTNDYMEFTIDRNAAKQGGNAVIGYTDPETGLMMWSWHIWVVTDDIFSKVQSYERTVNGKKTIYGMMDRNLGADDPNGSGDKEKSCLYQWGRKDPFSNKTVIYGPDGNTLDVQSWPSCEGYAIDPVWNTQMGRTDGDFLYNGTVDYTLSHPGMYISFADAADANSFYATWLRSTDKGHDNDRLWGTYFETEAEGAKTVVEAKSAFDPCPAGYRVPTIEPLTFGDGDFTGEFDGDGTWMYINEAKTEKAWFPYAGERFSKLDGGKLVGVLRYTKDSEYDIDSYVATLWSATLDFVKEIDVGTSCNSVFLDILGMPSDNYKPSIVFEGPMARCMAVPVRCVKEDMNGIGAGGE